MITLQLIFTFARIYLFFAVYWRLILINTVVFYHSRKVMLVLKLVNRPLVETF